MSAEPSASIWEVTRMILESPGTSPSVIAHAHGFSAVEVAELLPIFLDNLRADFSSADGPAPALVPPASQPGETPEEHADRYLRELAQNGHLDVVGYDTLAAVDGADPASDDLDSDDLDSDELDSDELDSDELDSDDLDRDDLGDDSDEGDGEELDPDLDDLGQDPTFLDTPVEAPPVEIAGLEDEPAADRPDVDPHEDDLVEDDPFAASVHPGTLDPFDDGVPGADDPGEPFALS